MYNLQTRVGGQVGGEEEWARSQSRVFQNTPEHSGAAAAATTAAIDRPLMFLKIISYISCLIFLFNSIEVFL